MVVDEHLYILIVLIQLFNNTEYMTVL